MSPSKVTAASITFTIVTTAAVLSNPITRHAHAFCVGPAQPLTQHHHHHHHALQQHRLFYHPSRLHYPVSVHRNAFLRPYWRGGAFFQMTATASDEDLEKEISSMKVSQIRQELESYGISTKSFFEKSELVEALVTARKEGKIPVVGGGGNASAKEDAAPSSSSTSPSSSSSSTSPSDTSNRQERIQQEIDKCNKLKIGELKKELESYGVSTKSYFEKSEFVRAVAEARVDGPPKTRETSSSSSSGGSRASGRVRDEPRDPSYRDVIVTKYPGNKSLLEGKIIEVRSR